MYRISERRRVNLHSVRTICIVKSQQGNKGEPFYYIDIMERWNL